MKPIFLIHIITQLELGGAQKIVLSILRGMDLNRTKIFLIAGSEGLLVEESKRIPGIETFWIPQLVRAIHPVKDLIALFLIYRIIKKVKREMGQAGFLIVHTHSSKAGILGRWGAFFAGARNIIHTVHGFGFNDYQNSLVRKIFIVLEKVSERITRKIVAVSGSNIQKGLDLKIFKKEKVLLIPGGIDLSSFRGKPLGGGKKREALGLPLKGPLIGMVACFKPQKSPLDFVRVAERVHKTVPEASFVMVGDGEMRSEIEDLIVLSGLREHMFLLGWSNEVPEILKILDVFVLTSLWEGLPIVFLEAMAAGLPIVGTQVDGASELIEEGVNGYLLAPQDVDGMSDRIIEIVMNPEKARQMVVESTKKVESFSIQRMIQSYKGLYCSLVSQTSP